MKTNESNNVPKNRPNQFPAGVATSLAGASTTRISDTAFYLIALAHLLRNAIGSQALQEMLIPGKFVGYGLSKN